MHKLELCNFRSFPSRILAQSDLFSTKHPDLVGRIPQSYSRQSEHLVSSLSFGCTNNPPNGLQRGFRLDEVFPAPRVCLKNSEALCSVLCTHNEQLDLEIKQACLGCIVKDVQPLNQD